MASQSCSCEDHFGSNTDNVPLAYGPPEPEHAGMVPDAERAHRMKMPNKVFCSVNNHGFHLRGQLLVPITDAAPDDEQSYFSWDIWDLGYL